VPVRASSRPIPSLPDTQFPRRLLLAEKRLRPGPIGLADRCKIVSLLSVQVGGAWLIVLLVGTKEWPGGVGVMYQMRPDGEKPGPL
jgi:hypothetical protein